MSQSWVARGRRSSAGAAAVEFVLVFAVGVMPLVIGGFGVSVGLLVRHQLDNAAAVATRACAVQAYGFDPPASYPLGACLATQLAVPGVMPAMCAASGASTVTNSNTLLVAETNYYPHQVRLFAATVTCTLFQSYAKWTISVTGRGAMPAVF